MQVESAKEDFGQQMNDFDNQLKELQEIRDSKEKELMQ